MSGLQLAEVSQHYTLALSGSIQKVTLAVDIDGTALDATGLVNIWADSVLFQNSNSSAQIVFIGYKTGGAPATLDKTRAALDLSVGQSGQLPRSNAAVLRGAQINLRDIYAKGTAGDYLHIIVPKVKPVTTA